MNDMTHEALVQLAGNLFSMIAALTGQPLISDALPEVHRVPQAQIEAMVCQQACRVRAIYLPHLGIYMDDDLDIKHNEFDGSILLHELVHYAQAVMGKYEDLSLCQSWKSSEVEAYAIQNDYLARVGSPRRIPPGIAQITIRCP